MVPSINSLFRLVLGLVVLAALAAPVAQAQANSEAKTGGPTAGAPDQARVDEIVRKFTAKETRFRHALNTYAFKRDALIQILGMGGQVVGEYHRVSEFTFDDQGNRYEKINFFPLSNIGEVITAEDLEDLGGVTPFALEPGVVSQYNFSYSGVEKIDDLNLYVFEVTPKVMPDPNKTKLRMFTGRIWVEQQDLLIVKTRGKGVPETKQNKFPIVETYREHIDGRYWFPTYSWADEELIFDSGNTLHLRMKVRYMDFTPARATLKVTEIGETDDSSDSNGPKPVEVGVMNSKASILPRPVYSEEARRQKATGRVTVKVVVDENGKVVSAHAIDGAQVLREPAEAAARRAVFPPTQQDGIVVRATGTLIYEFP